MNWFRRLNLACCIVIGVAPASGLAIDFSSTVLHSPAYSRGSIATSISRNIQGGYGDVSVGRRHALQWQGNSGNLQDLHGSNYDSSVAGVFDSSSFASQKVGTVVASQNSNIRATLWTENTVVDLHPTGSTVTASQAFGVWQDTQVGYVTTSNVPRATYWTGTAMSRVTLLGAAGTSGSQALGIWGSNIVGYSVQIGGGADSERATIWDRNSLSATLLHPSSGAFTGSRINGASEMHQVGRGNVITTSQTYHALLWSGTLNSMVDLHPTGFNTTEAMDADGLWQVGYGKGTATGNQDHALLWSGTANSVQDLHGFLPAGYSTSRALGVDASTGAIVGWARHTSTGFNHAVMWQAVPEPSSVVTLLLGGFGLAFRRFRPR